jgi:hypothetical protein
MTATVPSLTPVAPPADATVAIAALVVVQVTEDGSRANLVPSLKVPVVVKFCDVPIGMCLLVGVTAIDTRVAVVTVSDAVPEMSVVGSVAVTVVTPAVSGVTSPVSTFAIMELVTVQLTSEVIVCVVPLL